MSQRQCRIHVKVGKGQIEMSDERGNVADPEYSDRNQRDSFQWMSNAGNIEIQFDSKHPFDMDPPYTAEKGQWTPEVHVLPNAAPGPYKYTVTVTDGRQTYMQDPQVIIDDGRNMAVAEIKAAEALFTDVIARARREIDAACSKPIFPKGIDRISVEIRSGDLGVSIHVNGPKD